MATGLLKMATDACKMSTKLIRMSTELKIIIQMKTAIGLVWHELIEHRVR